MEIKRKNNGISDIPVLINNGKPYYDKGQADEEFERFKSKNIIIPKNEYQDWNKKINNFIESKSIEKVKKKKPVIKKSTKTKKK